MSFTEIPNASYFYLLLWSFFFSFTLKVLMFNTTCLHSFDTTDWDLFKTTNWDQSEAFSSALSLCCQSECCTLPWLSCATLQGGASCTRCCATPPPCNAAAQRRRLKQKDVLQSISALKDGESSWCSEEMTAPPLQTKALKMRNLAEGFLLVYCLRHWSWWSRRNRKKKKKK